MPTKQEFIIGIRGVVILYEKMLGRIEEKFGLTLLEANIISFLFNNPGKNTAADIVKYRMISKGNVSKGVESLICKDLLRREISTQDRRVVYLYLQSKANLITKEIEKIKIDFFKNIFDGVPESEQKVYFELNEKIIQNVKKLMINM